MTIKPYLIYIRLNNENWEWSKEGKHFWMDHEKSICNVWFIAYHSNCNCKLNVNKENVNEWMQIIKRELKSIAELKSQFETKFCKYNFGDELKYFWDKFLAFERRVRNKNLLFNKIYIVFKISRYKWIFWDPFNLGWYY